MSEEQKDLTSRVVDKRSVRPVMIATDRILYEYSMFLKRLLLGLTDQSVPSILVCGPGRDVESVISPSVEVVRHPVTGLPLLGRYDRKMLVERLSGFKPTVLHCLCESRAGLTMQLAREMDLPYVLTVNSLQRRWGRLSISSRHCAKIMTPAGSIAAKIARSYPGLAHRIKQINFGAFVDETRRRSYEAGEFTGMVTTHPVNKADDFDNLLRAVKHLVIDGYELMLVIMGSGRGEWQLRKLLRALGLLWVVTIVPRLTAWRSVLAAGHVFIRPQAIDTFDPFLLEAMSVGAAVAGCRGGVDDLIIEDKTCVVFDPDDELSIYSSLQRLFDRPEFARRLAASAQQYLRENHSVSKMVTDILQTYRDAEQWYRP